MPRGKVKFALTKVRTPVFIPICHFGKRWAINWNPANNQIAVSREITSLREAGCSGEVKLVKSSTGGMLSVCEAHAGDYVYTHSICSGFSPNHAEPINFGAEPPKIALVTR